MALHPAFIMRNIRITEADVYRQLKEWGVNSYDFDDSQINSAINFLALKSIGINYERLSINQQQDISDRCNTSRVFIRKFIQDENGMTDVSFYQVYLELFPSENYLSKAVKLN